MKKVQRVLAALLASQLAVSAAALAEEKIDETQLEDVVVTATPLPLDTTTVKKKELKSILPATSDTTGLLRDVPGVSLFSAGGISSLPVVHGMADDRLRIKVDGMDLISSCPNHMNSPLSYIDPTNVGRIKVMAGIVPVSLGGDSIGGAIIVDSTDPVFAKAGQGVLLKGSAGTFYRSNGYAKGGNLSATIAGEKVSLTYSGSTAQSENYKAAKDFKAAGAASTDKPGHLLDGDEVGSSFYKTMNNALDLALRHENHLLDLKLVYQHIPVEAYPNQRMDMTDNDTRQANLHYKGVFRWGALEARAYHEETKHEMDFADDKRFLYGTAPNIAPGMPMLTEGRNTGALVTADIRLSERDTVRAGVEYQRYRLDDWWPPSPSGQPSFIGGMSPNTFININDGERDRLGVFSEWESQINQQWLTSLGVRYERVRTDTGTVQGYNNAAAGMYYVGYLLSATQFNALDRERTDDNWDVTALARYTPSATTSVEFGYAHKTRSPNLYERYSWSRNAMALIMNNFVGDGNGYLGNPDLKPEKANTVSATIDVHSADNSMGGKATPYYTYVSDYIDAVQWDRTNNVPTTFSRQFGILKYMNQSARIYGLDLSGHMPLGKSDLLGDFHLEGLLNYTKGENRTTGDDLYNIMPLNAKIAVEQKLGGWTSRAELQMVDAKDNVSDARQEIKTDSYKLVNLRAGYEWKQVRVDFGVENLFDEFYALPLGGAYVGQGSTMSLNGVPWGVPVPGPGRSFYVGLTFTF